MVYKNIKGGENMAGQKGNKYALGAKGNTIKKYDAAEIKKIIRENWQLVPASNSNKYQKITLTMDLDFYQNQSKGRHYSVSRNFLSEKLMN